MLYCMKLFAEIFGRSFGWRGPFFENMAISNAGLRLKDESRYRDSTTFIRG